MHGTKRPAPSAAPDLDLDLDLDPHAFRPASKRLKSRSPRAPSQPSKSLLGSFAHYAHQALGTVTGLLQPLTTATNSRTLSQAHHASSRSRQRPREPLASSASHHADQAVHDEWIWQKMTAMQRGEPDPPTPTDVREIRAREQADTLARLSNGSNAGRRFGSGNGTARGAQGGAYVKKKPMGSRETATILPTPRSTPPRPRRQRRYPTPDWLKSPEPTDDASNRNGETVHLPRDPPRVSTRPLVASSFATYRPDILDVTTPSTLPEPLHPDPDRTRTASKRKPKSRKNPSPSPRRSTFFSDPWLPSSLLLIRRKQHRQALKQRDDATFGTLRTMTNPPSATSSATLYDLEGEGHASFEEDSKFRVYKQKVAHMVEQEDEGHAFTRSSNASWIVRNGRLIPHSSLLLGPSTVTYASVASTEPSTPAASSARVRSKIPQRPRTNFDRTIENYRSTMSESPARRADASRTFAEFEKLRIARERDELDAADRLDKEALGAVALPTRRKWPDAIPDEIRKRFREVCSDRSYSKTIPGAFAEHKNLERMKPSVWVDDSVVSFYAVLINNRFNKAQETGEWGEGSQRLKKVHCFNNSFWNFYNESGYSRVKKWTKRFDVFEKDIMIVPININNSHWTCAAVNIRDKRFEYYDSLGSRMRKAYTQLRKWLQEEHQTKKGKPIDLSDWEDYWDPTIPQQDNCNDCGVFTCAFMESLSREVEEFDFTQAQMPYLRQKIVYEIDKGELCPMEPWE
ncbi:hypothetical protein JCM10212_004975 [Sporobolomyces blumeae]